ncbi:MAG: hypothetical protein LBV03_04595 [Fusobacteriales bacterium]|jgi:hypothetical protein|nr:hypothetical protein [Fusobacteriales bacterium]
MDIKKIKKYASLVPSKIDKEYFIGMVSLYINSNDLTQLELNEIWYFFFSDLEIFRSMRVYVGRIIERITFSNWEEEFRMRVDFLKFLAKKHNIKTGDESLPKWLK